MSDQVAATRPASLSSILRVPVSYAPGVVAGAGADVTLYSIVIPANAVRSSGGVIRVKHVIAISNATGVAGKVARKYQNNGTTLFSANAPTSANIPVGNSFCSHSGEWHIAYGEAGKWYHSFLETITISAFLAAAPVTYGAANVTDQGAVSDTTFDYTQGGTLSAVVTLPASWNVDVLSVTCEIIIA